MNRPDKKSTRAAIKRHEFLSDTEAHARKVLLDHGIDADVSDQAAVAIADHLSEHWRGQVIVIPADYRYKVSQRDIYLYTHVYKGDVSALAAATGMTESGVYKMLKRVRRYNVEGQGDLFNAQDQGD